MNSLRCAGLGIMLLFGGVLCAGEGTVISIPVQGEALVPATGQEITVTVGQENGTEEVFRILERVQKQLGAKYKVLVFEVPEPATQKERDEIAARAAGGEKVTFSRSLRILAPFKATTPEEIQKEADADLDMLGKDIGVASGGSIKSPESPVRLSRRFVVSREVALKPVLKNAVEKARALARSVADGLAKGLLAGVDSVEIDPPDLPGPGENLRVPGRLEGNDVKPDSFPRALFFGDEPLIPSRGSFRIGFRTQ